MKSSKTEVSTNKSLEIKVSTIKNIRLYIVTLKVTRRSNLQNNTEYANYLNKHKVIFNSHDLLFCIIETNKA